MKRLIILALLAGLSTTVAQEKPLKRGVYAHFETSMGTFTALLEKELAPKTVENFVGLAQGTKAWKDPKTGQMVFRPFYDGLIFHRVVHDFIIQAGDPTGTGTTGPGFTIPDEFSAQLLHDQPGTLSMANRGQKNSGSSQFFVTLAEARALNKVNTVFGRVVRGMETVRKINSVRTRKEVPVAPVILQKVRIEVVE